MKLANTLLLLSLCHQLQTTLAQPPSDIEFVAFGFDLSNLNELWVTYDISTGETYAANLYEKDCSTSISDLNIESTTATTSLGDGGVTNATHDRLVLEYDIDTTNLESSNIWNAATSTIELCQVVQLKLGAFIVAEDIRRIDYNLDLNVDIVVDEGSGLIQMADHSSKELTGSGDLTHAIESCKCDAVNFVCNTDPLEPNSELHICIKSISSDVRIEAIELMLAYQGSFAMTIMSNNNPASTGLTSVRSNSIATDVPSTNGEITIDGVLVTTKLPFNFFDYKASEVVRVTGRVHTKLQESRRRLRSLPDEEESSSASALYEVIIALQEEEHHQEDQEDLSSAAFVSSGISLLVCVCIGIVIY